ncbi:MAG: beta-propeller domain-containing protein [Clostridium sp.]|nr:beta-propeller domain-containing protein [Clostridium sp.]
MRKRIAVLCMVVIMCSLTGCVGEQSVEPSQEGNVKVEATNNVQTKRAVKPVGDYSKLYRYLNKITKSQKPSILEKLSDLVQEKNMMVSEDIAVENVTAETEQSATEGGVTNYGTTNVMTEGVDESDVIKNDGTYLYILERGSQSYDCDYTYDDYSEDGAKKIKEESEDRRGLRIISVDKEKMEQVGFLPLENDYNFNEFYLVNDQIIVVYENYSNGQTEVCFYDVSDRTAPKFVKSISQDGGLMQSRVQGGYVYLMTEKYNDYKAQLENESCIPCVDGEKVSSDCIYIPKGANTKNFLTCSSISIEDKEVKDSVAITSAGDHFYMSNHNIYVGSYVYGKSEATTEIMRIQVEDGKLTATAKKTLTGLITDNFAMNEYGDHLRLVMERWVNGVSSSVLYVLDMDLQVTGKIKDIAPDEQIYSARFIGDTGYFVTFRQIDPLFSVDLSDPKNPKIIGELKIPGFSEYLHPYTEDLLLGIGYDVQDNHRDHIKLSMFDISEPSNVTEQDVKQMKGHEYASCMDAYKNLCINGEKNVFGFSAQRRYTKTDYVPTYDYILASYDKEKGFQLKTVYTEEDYGSSDLRGTYVGDTFYTISMDHEMVAIDLNTMEQIGSYEFQ